MIDDDTVKELLRVFGRQVTWSRDIQETYAERPDDGADYLSWHELITTHYEDEDKSLLSFVEVGQIARDSRMCDGSSVYESNFRSLRRDFPSLFYRVGYSGAEVLGVFLADLDDDTAGMLIHLVEQCPLYDESDMSELEDEQIRESWRQYASADLYRGMSGSVQDEWHAIGDERVEQLAWSLAHAAKEGRVPSIGYGSGEECVRHTGAEVSWDYRRMTAPLASAISHTAHKLRKRGMIT